MKLGLSMLGLSGVGLLINKLRKEKKEEAVPMQIPQAPSEIPPELMVVPPPPLPYLGSPEFPPGFRLLQLVTPNLTGRDVRAIQQALWEAGFYTGPIHGVFDYETSEALKRFQKAKGLPVTGIADRATWIALGVMVEIGGKLDVAPKYVVYKVGR